MESSYGLYSIYDLKAQRFGPLFEALTDEVAARNYAMVLGKTPKIFRAEYQLFKIGNFDFIKGELEQDEKPREISVFYSPDQIENLVTFDPASQTIENLRKSFEVKK